MRLRKVNNQQVLKPDTVVDEAIVAQTIAILEAKDVEVKQCRQKQAAKAAKNGKKF